MLSCSIWFSAPSFWMGGGLESRCVGRVYGADGVMRHHSHPTTTTYSTSNASDDGCMYPKHFELRIYQKIILLHQVGISHYFI